MALFLRDILTSTIKFSRDFAASSTASGATMNIIRSDVARGMKYISDVARGMKYI